MALGLDAVVVAVPDPAHLATCLEALDAGLHVFCEKPLVTRLADADALIAARGDRVLQCGYMKLYDPAVERLVELLDDGPAELVYLSVEVNDPDQLPFVDHLGLLAGHDVPADLVARTRAAGAQAVDDTLGRPGSPAEARAFEAYLSALVHDVSLAHHVLEALGHRPPLPIADAAYFDAGRGVSLSWALHDGARAHLTHLNLPGVGDYTERVTVFCRDRILELTFPSPYLRFHPTQLVEKRSGRDRRRPPDDAAPGLLRGVLPQRAAGVPRLGHDRRARPGVGRGGAGGPARAPDRTAGGRGRAGATAGEGGLMRIGLFTDGLKHLSRRDAFAWCVEHGITDVEMSVGTWGARTHLDLDRLLARRRRARRCSPATSPSSG